MGECPLVIVVIRSLRSQFFIRTGSMVDLMPDKHEVNRWNSFLPLNEIALTIGMAELVKFLNPTERDGILFAPYINAIILRRDDYQYFSKAPDFQKGSVINNANSLLK